MKKLKIYKDKDEFVIERVNQFNHSTKRFFISEQGLIEGLEVYTLKDISQYEIQASHEVWAMVINSLVKMWST
ncbi:hypothetical protein [Neobacillus vireti]|uniref:Uncharacterized protein n=1 Tax=Neobacillus vireti LMG 21834 TaxID=1131730 RepID=A0AB94IJP6_9BACI|nr:hypothetical protein [Neobacillus vireti]ETI67258.1 hypothetical protein BAVI_18452 [Neobacillus vireti LMG 21834]KLT19653.1 hypothetical protein AA980_03420 [Neobacillus vireti]